MEMTMETVFQKFVSEEKGAVTVDWVVLGLGVLSLCAAVFGTVQAGSAQASTTNLTDGTGVYLQASAPLDNV